MQLAATIAYRDNDVVAIEDADPKAPLHLLVIPLRHHATLYDLTADDAALSAHLMGVAARLGSRHAPNGFRLVVNTGEEGGQTVNHVHVHVLAGRRLAWPPG